MTKWQATSTSPSIRVSLGCLLPESGLDYRAGAEQPRDRWRR